MISFLCQGPMLFYMQLLKAIAYNRIALGPLAYRKLIIRPWLSPSIYSIIIFWYHP